MTRDEMIEGLEAAACYHDALASSQTSEHAQFARAIRAALRAPAVTGEAAKALAALNVLEGMARCFVRQNDGFDTTKKFADDVRAALAAPPAAGAPPAEPPAPETFNLDDATPLERGLYNMGREVEQLPASALQTRLSLLLSTAMIELWRTRRLSAADAAPPAAGAPPTGWTPEYIASALARAYPQSCSIDVGDVIEFAHGDDAPMFQKLTHPAAVEDWNGKLRDRVRGIYKPAVAPPALVALVQEFQAAEKAWGDAPVGWSEGRRERIDRVRRAEKALLAWSPAPVARKPFTMNVSREWVMRMAEIEAETLGSPAPAPVAPPVAATAVEGAQDEACLTCGMPRSMSKEPEAHQWPSTSQANVCPGCGSVDRSFKRIRNRKVCRDVWHDSVPAPVAPPAVAGGDAPEIQVGDLVRVALSIIWGEKRDWRVVERDGRRLRVRRNHSTGYGEWTWVSYVDEVERNGVVIWRRRQEGQ